LTPSGVTVTLPRGIAYYADQRAGRVSRDAQRAEGGMRMLFGFKKADDEAPLKPIGGAQESEDDWFEDWKEEEAEAEIGGGEAGLKHRKHVKPFVIRTKVIDDGCCQLDCIEPEIQLTVDQPDAVQIDSCRVNNIETQGMIVSPGVVAARVTFDLIVTYIDANGNFVTVQETFTYPPQDQPPKMVSLPSADRSIHQVVVEAELFCDICMIQNAGRTIRCRVFIFVCIKIGRHLQLKILAKEVELPKCERVEAGCPPPDLDPPSHIKKLFRSEP